MFVSQNFACTIIEAQNSNNLVDANGNSTPFAILMDQWDLFFTIIFTVELAINVFCHILVPFITNPWNWLDVIIVTVSIVGVVTVQPTGIVRILRALRVIRLFGRVSTLRRIVSALTCAILPVCNVFLIYFLLLGIGSLPRARRQRKGGVAARSGKYELRADGDETAWRGEAWRAPAREQGRHSVTTSSASVAHALLAALKGGEAARSGIKNTRAGSVRRARRQHDARPPRASRVSPAPSLPSNALMSTLPAPLACLTEP